MRQVLSSGRLLSMTTASVIARIAVAIVAGIVLFTGCTTVQFGSTFRVDGTATHTLEVTLPRASLNELDLARVERQIADAEINARAAGLTTARIDNPETIGIRVINTTQDATDAGLALSSIFNTLVIDETTGPVAPFQGRFERISEAVGGNSFKLELMVDGDLLYAAAAKIAPGHPQFSTSAGVREIVKIEYIVTMPGEITVTNGGRRGTGTVAWTIPLQVQTQLEARSTVGKDTPWLWTIAAIIGAFAVVAVSAALVWTILLGSHRARRMRVAISSPKVAAGPEHTPSESHSPPRSLREVRLALSVLTRRVFQGERLDARLVRPKRRPLIVEDPSHGSDPKGD